MVDARAFDGREIELQPYRRRAAARPREFVAQYELALMIWFQDFSGAPGPVLEAEPPLCRALERSPRNDAGHGLRGEVLLRAGRYTEAALSFAEAARLRPRHPRYHYCARFALQRAGDFEAAERALAAARRVAGPRLQEWSTRGSNPLEDYRLSLLKEALRLRKKREASLFVR